MMAAGFKPLATEWWHFTLRDEPYPDTYFDFPVGEPRRRRRGACDSPGRRNPLSRGGVGARLGDRLGAGVADQQLRPHRPAVGEVERREAPIATSAASSAITVVSPPSAAGADAITVSEPPSTMLRAAASARRATAGETYSSESTITTASAPRAATRRACSTACSTAWPCASAEAAKVDGGGRLTGPSSTRDLLGPHAGEHDASARRRPCRPARRRCGAAPRSCRRGPGRRPSRASPCRTGSATRSP